MKNLLPFALLAVVALSAPPVQGNASAVENHVILNDTAEQNATAHAESFVLTNAHLEFATLNALGTTMALGCCDQSYPVNNASAFCGTCDQSYPVNNAVAIPKPLLAIVFASFLLLMWTTTNHFKRTTSRWTLEH